VHLRHTVHIGWRDPGLELGVACPH
jgi:hypothetical protein